MKKANNFLLIVFLLVGVISFASFEAISQPQSARVKCPRSFRKNRHRRAHIDNRQPTLFDMHSEALLSPTGSRQTSLDYSKGVASRDLDKKSSEVKRKKRLTKQQKKKAKQDFLTAFKNENLLDMKRLVEEFPFLKEVRFTDPAVLEGIHEKDRRWCPKGWGPLQIAAYKKQGALFDFLLSLDMNVRTIKKPGNVSIENNSLHISIKRNFRVGAIKVLEYVGLVRFGMEANRFIDEKDHMKMTPWALAVKRDSIRRRINYIKIVGEYNPSGYVKSYTLSGPRDGYEIADATGSDVVKQYADMYLVAPQYFKYKEIRESSLRPDLKAPF